jgi:hypothetical protein
MLNNVVGYWAYIRGGGAYIRNEVSVSTCGGLTHGGAYIWRFTVAWKIFLALNPHLSATEQQSEFYRFSLTRNTSNSEINVFID